MQKRAHENKLLIVLQETLKVNEDVINYFKERFNHVNGSPTIYPPKFDLEITIDEQEFGLHVDCFAEEYGTNFNIPCPVGKDSEEALLIVVDMLINKVWGLERSKGDIESCFGEKTVQVGMRYKRVPKFRSTFSVKEFQD
ncbi:hypothetical protein HK103_006248 [Boothiomyces macroporosus]|uniref:Uncharacterized protein n=1 Tax=Boothiomyces macroporosus TaxID=261099 RepID=A0AAD5UE05_9FUNG|nr:hypothetical protein HK103_006248 [Boothiomyces macroporosus]